MAFVALYAGNAHAQMVDEAPSAPTNLIATSPQHGQTKLQWQTPASSGSQDITKYQYRRRTNSDSADWAPNWTDLAGSDKDTTETILTVPEAEATTIYRFQVRALNSDDMSGEGAASNEATLLPRIGILSFSPSLGERFSITFEAALIPDGVPVTFRFHVTVVGDITGTIEAERTASITPLPGRLVRAIANFTKPNDPPDSDSFTPFVNDVIESDRDVTVELLPDANDVISYSPDVTASQRMFVLPEDDEPASLGLDFTNEAGDASSISCSDGMTTERTTDSQAAIIGIRFLSGSTSAKPLPSDNLTLTFTSSDPSEAKLALSPDDTPVSPLIVPDAVNNLGFIRNAGLEQSIDYLGPIYVIGQDDDVDEEPARTTYTISFASESANPDWNSLAPDAFCRDTIGFTNLDDDTAAVNVARADPVQDPMDPTTEAGGAGAFTVALASEPTAEVLVTVTADDPAETPAKTLTLTFDADNWNTSQTVTVIGQGDDAGDTPMTPTTISFAVASDDPFYDDAREPMRGVTPASLQVDGPVTALEGPAGSALRLRLRLRVFLESALP